MQKGNHAEVGTVTYSEMPYLDIFTFPSLLIEQFHLFKPEPWQTNCRFSVGLKLEGMPLAMITVSVLDVNSFAGDTIPLTVTIPARSLYLGLFAVLSEYNLKDEESVKSIQSL